MLGVALWSQTRLWHSQQDERELLNRCTSAKLRKHNGCPKAPGMMVIEQMNCSAPHEPAPRLFRTVWARRFCDQHEMSLQTATGRSLP